MECVLDAGLHFLHLHFRCRANLHDGHAAGKFRETFLEFFFVVIRVGPFNLRLDLLTAAFDVLLGARVITLDLAFVIQIVNFFVLLFVLNTFLYKPIRKALADRSAEIEGARQKAESVDAGVQEKIAAYEARMRDVKAQAALERAEMKKSVESEEQALLEKARLEASETINAIRAKVAKETADARELLRSQALLLSSDICEKVLGRSL